MRVGELEEYKIYNNKLHERDRFYTHTNRTTKDISKYYSYRTRRSGYIGLMCPHCYDFTIRKTKLNLLSEVESFDDADIISDVVEYPELVVYPKVDYILNQCEVCGERDVHLIEIDPNIVEAISILNKKGYKTRFCCEGHGDENTLGYILFDNFDILDYIHTLPLTWNFDTYGWTHYKKWCKIDSFAFNYPESLIDILKWAKSLPRKNKSRNVMIADEFTFIPT